MDVTITDAPPGDRERLDPILDSSFEGWYLWHSKRTLREIPTVRVASVGREPVGLSMLKELDKALGYVYYIAVSSDHRRQGIGGRLLDDAMVLFEGEGDETVYACAEEHNLESIALFKSRGFERITFHEMTKVHGPLKAIRLVNSMRAVPGEIIMRRFLISP